MESKIKLLGHPIHPMLIAFPFGLLATSFIFDIIRMLSNNTVLGEVSFWMIGAGIVGGLLAALFGFLDWLAVPNGTRAKMIGMWHGLGNVVVVVLFWISFLMRAGMTAHVPDAAAQVLSLVGIVIALGTGWLGGELVDRLRVGVDDGANLNAPSSLSGRPVTEPPPSTQVHSTHVGR